MANITHARHLDHHLGGDAWEMPALRKMAQRGVRESWTVDDLKAAMLQFWLLSYRSAAEQTATVPGADHFLYIASRPEDYRHNCPWNDWLPPSQSRKLFEEATARKQPGLIDQRVRVRLVSKAQNNSPQSGLVVFVTVERDRKGRARLVLRRGADTLAMMHLTSVRILRIGTRMVAVTLNSSAADPSPNQVSYLSFENDARMDKFQQMLGV